jgi:CRP-like cAMP-binding protein
MTLEEAETLLLQVGNGQLKSFEKGEPIFLMEEPVNHLGILIEGELESKKLAPCGQHLNICIKKPGEIFAHAYLFNQEDTSPVEVYALAASKVLFLTRDYVIKLMQASQTFLYNYLYSISATCCFLHQRIDVLSYHSIRKKAVYYMLNQRLSKDVSGCLYLELPFSKKMWADTINVSRSSLSRELAHLESENLIKVDKRKIFLLDFDKLNNIILD